MKRFHPGLLAAAFAFSEPFGLATLDAAGPHLRRAKPVTHGPRGKRSKAERSARKAARRARARSKR